MSLFAFSLKFHKLPTSKILFVRTLCRPTLHQFDVLLYRSVSLGISSVSVYLEFHFYGIDSRTILGQGRAFVPSRPVDGTASRGADVYAQAYQPNWPFRKGRLRYHRVLRRAAWVQRATLLANRFSFPATCSSRSRINICFVSL